MYDKFVYGIAVGVLIMIVLFLFIGSEQHDSRPKRPTYKRKKIKKTKSKKLK